MRKDDDGIWRLDHDHTYYYQVQLQMHVCDVQFSDFVVWTKNTTIIETIAKNEAFIDKKVQDAKKFFIYGVLPEIVGKWYTQAPVADDAGVVQTARSNQDGDDQQTTDDNDESRLWCYCEKPSCGEMIMCDNKKCSIQWFHFQCLGITIPPKGKWYCPNCRKLSRFKRSKK